MKLPESVRHPNKATLIVSIAVGGAIFAIVLLARLWPNPEFVYLNDRGGAHWIYHEYAKLLNTIRGQLTTGYYTGFSVSTPPESAVLEIQALKSFRVRIDGQVIRDFQEDDPQTWKTVTRIDLAPYLTQGNQRLEVIVVNELGPTAIWARCPELNIYTNEDWKVYLGSGQMGEAVLCREQHIIPVSYDLGHVWTHFLRALPILAPLFILSFVFALRFPTEKLDAYLTNRTAKIVAGLSVAALLILGLNNMFRLDYRLGYDARYHYEYIEWILDQGEIPLASDGWQMFQSPLFYLITAPIYAINYSSEYGGVFGSAGTSTFHYYPIKLVSIVCGAMHPIVAYLFASLVWPGRPRLIIFTTLFGGFLPMTIYMSQFVGNEPMMGLIGAVVLLLGAHVLKGDGPPSMRLSIACGIALGLALLTKASAVLLVPACFAAFVSRFWGREGALPEFLKKLGAVAVACFLVSGWYYIRNWILLGQPFVGGWEPREGMAWWQAPGYRMWYEYAQFGRALTYPIYSAFSGLWDGLYTTFWLDGLLGSLDTTKNDMTWNASLLGASAWVALLPMLTLIIGSVVPVGQMLRRPREPWSFVDRLQVFSLVTILLFLWAIFYMHLRVPIWSGGKASYMTACSPIVAFLAARGYAMLRNTGPVLGAIVFAWFACWFFTAYFTYFVTLPIMTEF